MFCIHGSENACDPPYMPEQGLELVPLSVIELELVEFGYEHSACRQVLKVSTLTHPLIVPVLVRISTIALIGIAWRPCLPPQSIL